MKIGMMGGWNTNSGASFHAELVGREWVKMGHTLDVFTFYDYAFHGTAITGKDESYVERCFTVPSYNPTKLDPVPFLTKDYDFFVVQDLGMLPKDELGKIFHRIKEKAKVVNVIHDGKLSDNSSFYQFDWDAIVCFDKRYRKFLVDLYNSKQVHIIPYPCLTLGKGDKLSKRKKLKLPSTKKIVLGFGPAASYSVELIPALKELAKKYPLLCLIVTKEKGTIKKFKENAKLLPIEIREESPEVNRLYDYLHSSDVLIFNKPSLPQVVVSSTAFQCLSSGCPMVTKASNFVEYFDKEVLKYSNLQEFKKQIVAVLDGTKELDNTLKAMDKYVSESSAKVVAKRFIELFKSL